MENQNKNKKRWWAAGIGILVVIAAASSYFVFFQTTEPGAESERFVIPLNADESATSLLKSQGFIKNTLAFNIAFALRGGTEPGGYRISKSQSPWQIAGVLSREPYMKWVVIPEGLRKEEIAELLAETLNWPETEKEKWINTYTTMEYDYVEGVYFPDTYLIPVEEPPLEVAKRLRARFEEKFAPLAEEAVAENIKWITLLKLASLVQREASGKEDMPLISGILWNRLLQDMRLEVDATLQYARGNEGSGWWASITPAEKQIDSPYNTYRHTGLPPHPIANPGLSAMEAALRPASTTCLYYLHDRSGEIHCSETYEGHQKNIEEYL